MTDVTRTPTSFTVVSGTWTASSGTQLAAVQTSGDGIYVNGAANNDTMSVGFTAFALPSNATITNIRVTVEARGATSSGCSYQASPNNGTSWSATQAIASATFATFNHNWATNPVTSNPWTYSEVNALTYVRIQTIDATPDVYIGYVAITATYTAGTTYQLSTTIALNTDGSSALALRAQLAANIDAISATNSVIDKYTLFSAFPGVAYPGRTYPGVSVITTYQLQTTTAVVADGSSAITSRLALPSTTQAISASSAQVSLRAQLAATHQSVSATTSALNSRQVIGSTTHAAVSSQTSALISRLMLSAVTQAVSDTTSSIEKAALTWQLISTITAVSDSSSALIKVVPVASVTTGISAYDSIVTSRLGLSVIHAAQSNASTPVISSRLNLITLHPVVTGAQSTVILVKSLQAQTGSISTTGGIVTLRAGLVTSTAGISGLSSSLIKLLPIAVVTPAISNYSSAPILRASLVAQVSAVSGLYASLYLVKRLISQTNVLSAMFDDISLVTISSGSPQVWVNGTWVSLGVQYWSNGQWRTL